MSGWVWMGNPFKQSSRVTRHRLVQVRDNRGCLYACPCNHLAERLSLEGATTGWYCSGAARYLGIVHLQVHRYISTRV